MLRKGLKFYISSSALSQKIVCFSRKIVWFLRDRLLWPKDRLLSSRIVCLYPFEDRPLSTVLSNRIQHSFDSKDQSFRSSTSLSIVSKRRNWLDMCVTTNKYMRFATAATSDWLITGSPMLSSFLTSLFILSDTLLWLTFEFSSRILTYLYYRNRLEDGSSENQEHQNGIAV